jgi:tetratricopeptide (TPR) repeat protein
VRFGSAANAQYVMISQLQLLLARVAAGDHETALAQLGGTAALAAMVAADSVPPVVRLLLAHAALRRGDLDEARRLQKEAAALDAIPFVRMFAAFLSAEIALAGGEYASAARIAHEALESPYHSRLQLMERDLEWMEGDALLRAGDLSAASSALERTRAKVERLGSRRTLWLILWSLSRLADAEGRPSDGLKLRRQAREIVDAIAESLVPLGLAESFKRTPEASALLAETRASEA